TPTRARLSTVPNDVAQFGEYLVGQRPHGPLVMQPGGVHPGELQDSALDPAHHVEHVRPGLRRTDIRVEPAPGTPVQHSRPGYRTVELAEVVEADFRSAAGSEFAGQVAQRPVPEPPVGYRAQLLLHRLEHAAQIP